jgi:DNA replication protein DnaC
MDFLDFSRSKALNNIPNRKLIDAISSITESGSARGLITTAFNRYSESNIPVEYWFIKIDSDFKGDPRLLNEYHEYIKDIKSSYVTGKSICFAGNYGTGKTTITTSILKKACQKGYTCLYTTLSDIVSITTGASNEEKYLAKRELAMVDFLVIDEFDSRFMPSDNAADLYARSLENVFRTRSQNKIPTLMCTNSPNIVESFNGPLKESINSLMKGYLKVFPVFGEDYRIKKQKEG